MLSQFVFFSVDFSEIFDFSLFSDSDFSKSSSFKEDPSCFLSVNFSEFLELFDFDDLALCCDSDFSKSSLFNEESACFFLLDLSVFFELFDFSLF